jgi:hypothetical protein
MGEPLREPASLRQLADSGQVIEISAKVADFQRLAESIERDVGAEFPAAMPGGWRDRSVHGELHFRYLSPGDETIVMEGVVRTDVPAVCQRCLEVFDYPLATTMQLVFEEPGQERSRDGYETWELPGPSVTPLDIVDEGLVMAMPLAAKHEASAACRPAEAAGDDGMTRPFASLRERMEDKDS